jgi:AcrR family transcriptional regulator
MLDALVELIAADGYANVTVGGIAAAAGVSRSTFYEQFDDKEDCFRAAYDDVANHLIEAIVAAVVAAGDVPRARLGAGIDAYLTWAAEHPEAAATFTIAVHTAGPPALAQRAEVMRRFEQVIANRRPDVRPVAIAAVIASIDAMVHECVRQGRAAKLPELAPDARHVAEKLLA